MTISVTRLLAFGCYIICHFFLFMSGESKILHEWFAAGEARSEVVRFSTLN